MGFCKDCGSILNADTKQGVLVFKCDVCPQSFDSKPEDSLRSEIDYAAAETSEKFVVLEEQSPYDTAGKKVGYKCPKCPMPYLTHIYIGTNYISKYVCRCGYKILSKDFDVSTNAVMSQPNTVN
jgi:DNA-directed RNA polymerase subunit M/transcription elongation factor TFIIS